MTERNEITNKYNINDTVTAKHFLGEFKIISIELEKRSIGVFIWYKLCRISGGYTCYVKEENITTI